MTRMRAGEVTVDGGRLSFELAGEGPDVVLLHPGLWDAGRGLALALAAATA